jgi:hypothetical protein
MWVTILRRQCGVRWDGGRREGGTERTVPNGKTVVTFLPYHQLLGVQVQLARFELPRVRSFGFLQVQHGTSV